MSCHVSNRLSLSMGSQGVAAGANPSLVSGRGHSLLLLLSLSLLLSSLSLLLLLLHFSWIFTWINVKRNVTSGPLRQSLIRSLFLLLHGSNTLSLLQKTLTFTCLDMTWIQLSTETGAAHLWVHHAFHIQFKNICAYSVKTPCFYTIT